MQFIVFGLLIALAIVFLTYPYIKNLFLIASGNKSVEELSEPDKSTTLKQFAFRNILACFLLFVFVVSLSYYLVTGKDLFYFW